MDKFIGLLLQRTANGATYLQVIIIGILILAVFTLIFYTAKDVSKSFTNEEKYEDGQDTERM